MLFKAGGTMASKLSPGWSNPHSLLNEEVSCKKAKNTIQLDPVHQSGFFPYPMPDWNQLWEKSWEMWLSLD